MNDGGGEKSGIGPRAGHSRSKSKLKNHSGLIFAFVQLNLHETDLLFRYLSHHLARRCSSIYEDLHRFANFFLLFLNNFAYGAPKIVQKQ